MQMHLSSVKTVDAVGRDRQCALWFTFHRLFRNLVFHYALRVAFYLQSGLDFSQIGLIEGCYWLTKAVFDVPTGLLADALSQKFCVVAGSIFVSTGMFGLSLSNDFINFILFDFLIALGHSLCTGADSALVRNALIDKSRYPSIEQLGWSARNSALALSMVIGGLLLNIIDLRTIIQLSATSAFIAAAGAMMIKENQSSAIRFSGTISASFSLLKGKTSLSLLLCYLVLHTADFSGIWIFQVVMTELNVAPSLVNIYFATIISIAALCFLLFRRADMNNSALLYRMTLGCAAFILLVLVGASLPAPFGTIVVLGGYTIYAVVRAAYFPAIRVQFLAACPRDKAATVLSIVSVFGGVSLAVINPWLGHTIEGGGVKIALATSFVVALVAAIVLYLTCNSRTDKFGKISR